MSELRSTLAMTSLLTKLQLTLGVIHHQRRLTKNSLFGPPPLVQHRPIGRHPPLPSVDVRNVSRVKTSESQRNIYCDPDAHGRVDGRLPPPLSAVIHIGSHPHSLLSGPL